MNGFTGSSRKKDLFTCIIMIACAVLSVVFSGFADFSEDCEKTPESVIRLHVLANSDSESDQNLKYAVRDYIIEYMDGILTGSESLAEAEKILASKLPEILSYTRDFISASGYNYDLNAEICEMYFTTRVYENITLPAGDYKALRISIGEGKGQNWWCVIFPPLCLPSCTENNGDFHISAEMSRIIEQNKGKTEYKFAIYEWLRNMVVKK